MNIALQRTLERVRSLEPGAQLPSPCNSVCRMHAGTGLCIGCFRTLDEIAAWSTMSDAAKSRVYRSIEERAGA